MTLTTAFTKSGNEKHWDTVYNAMIAAIIASFATAYLFASMIESTTAGAGREILEGATALFAVVVLIETSAWLGGKADARVWKKYIQGMVDKSMTSGKAKALALAAFLAVYREGAEVILFYQALFNNSSSDIEMIWAGFVAGCVLVAILFFALQMGVLKIPLKPFFLFTSVLILWAGVCENCKKAAFSDKLRLKACQQSTYLEFIRRLKHSACKSRC